MGTAVPVQVPAWQVSPVVQTVPSSHGVPSATGGPLHFPAWQVSGPVQVVRTWLVEGTGAAVGGRRIPKKKTPVVQSVPSREGVGSATGGPGHTPRLHR